jgi:hypothetical protein
MPIRRAHYVVSTHWDREWYQTFQDFRYRLVQLLDRVLDGLADGRLKGPFQTDGQAIILEDYLEVRPERRDQVAEYVRRGLLAVGPWYALPDEFLVSGEALIRNLRAGRALARSFGGQPSDAGFVCDIFGHNSQMPQILKGFGIRGGLIWRGTNAVDTRNVIWRGADGTELPCYRFGEVGYCTYASLVRGARFHEEKHDPALARARLERMLEREAALSPVDPLLLFDGCDHQEWDQEAYGAIAERLGGEADGYEVVHSTLDAYLGEMLAQADRIETVLEGELREPGRFGGARDQQWLIPGVLSSRVWIKQWNARCQTLLTSWAEPLTAVAQSLAGLPDPQGYLDVAWQWLLKNHPHDSICGCSIDQVHEDMKYRFHQCEGIAERLTLEATRALAAGVAGDLDEDALRVTVFNPLPEPFDGTSELTLQIPDDWPTFNEFFGFEPKPAFRVFGADGQEVAYQRLGQAMGRAKTRIRAVKFPEAYRTNDVEVSLRLRVPAMGYTTLTVKRGETHRIGTSEVALPTRHPEAKGLATSECSMANESIGVTIEPNGTLAIADLRTGHGYRRLLTFEDVADIGDGWYHGVAINDQCFTSTGAHAEIALVHNGPLLTTFRVRTTMHVPAEFDFRAMRRSEEFTPLVIDSLVSLRPGGDRVEVVTTVHNAARDHRLRVLFPSGASAETYLADSIYDVVRRPIALRADNHLYRELEVETKPQQTWTAVSAQGRGLAIISEGLLESAVRDVPDRPVALTLLRATRRTVMTDSQPEGQLPGEWTFRYWIAPLAGEPDAVRLSLYGQGLAAGLRNVQLRPADLDLYAAPRALAAEASFLQVTGDLVLSSARRVGAALEVRLYNPTTRPADGELRLGRMARDGGAFTACQPVDLESNPLGERRAFSGGEVRVTLRPKEILTLRLT